jgi:hypothetical protein
MDNSICGEESKIDVLGTQSAVRLSAILTLMDVTGNICFTIN